MGHSLNKLSVASIRNADQGATLQDGGGLFLKKTASGGRWTYRYQFEKRRRDMGLGSFPEVSLADARKERNAWATELERGNDPISERERQRDAVVEERRDPSLKDMVDMAFELRKDRLKNDRARDKWISPLRVHLLPKLGKRRISTLHQKDFYDLLKPIWRSKNETADKILYRTRMALNDAMLSGFDADPTICDKARHLLGYVERVQEPIPATPWAEIPDLFARLEKEDHPSYLALRFAILTAARSTPVRGAKFDEIDGSVWTVPANRMKGQRGKVADFRVPLSDAASVIVEKCRNTAVNEFLFPSPRANKGISDQAWTKVLNGLDEPGRPHGFRTSFRTWVQDNHPSNWEAAETALSHTIGNKVERAYARSDLIDQRRILMQKWADFVTDQESKVIVFPSRA